MSNLFGKNYGKLNELTYRLRKSIYLLEAPAYVQWVATHKCNYSCEHCGTSAGKALCNELTTKEAENLINEMADMGVKFLSVTGGEPLLRPDLFHLLNLAKRKGIGVGFVTHGGLVSKHLKQIEELHPYSMMVSIDGLRDTHNKLRGDNANFDNSLDAIKFFKKIGIHRISISTTVNQRNFTELEKLKDIVFNSGANHWRINIAIPEGRAKNKKWMRLTNDQLLELFKFIYTNRKKFKIEICEGTGYLGEWDTKLKDAPFFCGCGWNTCTVMADGTVMGCPVFEEKEKYSEGNIRDSSFKEIWENRFERFRNLKLPDDCTSCKHLPACRGGCWMMRIYGANCIKDVWETNKPDHIIKT
jgi:radical SAM protein with 4Fe4S-binding SPASM domain